MFSEKQKNPESVFNENTNSKESISSKEFSSKISNSTTESSRSDSAISLDKTKNKYSPGMLQQNSQPGLRSKASSSSTPPKPRAWCVSQRMKQYVPSDDNPAAQQS